MSEAGQYDLNLVAGERYDRVFHWKNAATGALMPMAGFTAVMTIYGGQDQLLTSAGATPGIGLVQEPAGSIGELDLHIGGDVITGLFVPLEVNNNFFSYRLNLVDNAHSDNIIPLLHGSVIVGRRYGQ